MKTLRVLAVTAAVLVAGACEADVRTHVTPGRGDTATVEVTVTATAELADMLRRDRSSTDELVSVIERAAGQRPVRDDDGEQITWKVDASIDTVTGSSGLTGIVAIDVTGDGEQVQITVAEPARLAAAIATIEDPDGANATAQQTRVAVEVHYPGGVHTATPAAQLGGATVSDVSGDTATYGWPVAEPAVGTLTVTGNPDAPRSWWPFAAGGVAAVAAAAWWLRRRPSPAG